MKRKWKFFLLILVVVIFLSQFVPVKRDNPPVIAEINLSSEVMPILKRACYDCHSNKSVWPWYSYIAPISWVIAYDVKEGREELNFSNWMTLDQRKQTKMVKEVWKEVKEGEMPPWLYRLAHVEARLTPGDISTLQEWVKSYAISPDQEKDKPNH